MSVSRRPPSLAPTATPSTDSANRSVIAQWGLLTAGLAVLYVPVFAELATGIWTSDQNSHGPIVLAVAAWYFWFRARQIAADSSIAVVPSNKAGAAMLVFGVLLYVIGRSQDFYLFAVGSMIPVLAGLILMLFGHVVLRQIWFAFFFLFFAVPLPGALVDLITHPMKVAVSWGAEHLLWWAHYPVSRSGVILNIGPYQLLVADACAGLNSLFTLEALGLLYMNVIRHESALRNTALALLIVPISFIANLLRVVVLCLITYHMGDAAGQGFLHGFSGMVLFLSALFLVISMDGILRKVSARLKFKS